MKKYQAKSRKGLIGGIIAGLLVIGAVTSVAVLSKGFTNFDYKNWFKSETEVVDTRENLRVFDFTSEITQDLDHKKVETLAFLNASCKQEGEVVFADIPVDVNNGNNLCCGHIAQSKDGGLTIDNNGYLSLSTGDYHFNKMKLILSNYCVDIGEGHYAKESGGSTLLVDNYFEVQLGAKSSETERDTIVEKTYNRYEDLGTTNYMQFKCTKGKVSILGMELWTESEVVEE